MPYNMPLGSPHASTAHFFGVVAPKPLKSASLPPEGSPSPLPWRL